MDIGRNISWAMIVSLVQCYWLNQRDMHRKGRFDHD
jgi:hypothetical protein